jgi:predicted negative regulator of RcsB-dependent stress response
MDWIKRNLYFLVGGVVALALMGMAGWFLYSKWRLNSETWDRLNQDYSELGTLNSASPHPGSGKVDNIKLAKEQEAA